MRVIGDDPLNFEPWSNDDDDTCPGTYSRLTCTRPSNKQIFAGNRMELMTLQIRVHDHKSWVTVATR
ncbi:hypothetical protein TNCV_67601 [Trichonephila clavipes]|nr:hypothetical protein TNCV_67601 [Trichonephila clavipes]